MTTCRRPPPSAPAASSRRRRPRPPKPPRSFSMASRPSAGASWSVTTPSVSTSGCARCRNAPMTPSFIRAWSKRSAGGWDNPSRRANAIEELFDLVLEMGAHIREFLGRFQHQARCGSGFAGFLGDLLDIAGDIEGAGGGSLDALRDALGCGALLLDRGRNRRGDLADALDRLPDRLDRIDGLFGGALHVDDVRGDLVGGLCGLARQRLDLLRHHRKSASSVAGAR